MSNTANVSAEKPVRPYEGVHEHELVRLVKLGNKPAFDELVSRTSDLCLKVASCILGSREEARDEVQNAFWLAYSRIELFTYSSKFSTWLVRIVINRCFVRLRVAQRNPVLTNQVPRGDGSWYSCDAVTRQTPEMELGTREVHHRLRSELRSIPSLLRVPLEMHYIRELSVREVASELGLTVAATKSRLHRGHLYLRDRMLKHAARRGPAALVGN